MTPEAMTPGQFQDIKHRAEAAHLPPAIRGEEGDYMVSADGYTMEYANGDILAHFPLDPSGEGDYEAYNHRQSAQAEFVRYANRDVRVLIAALEKAQGDLERLERERDRLLEAVATGKRQYGDLEKSLDDCAGRLVEAAQVIRAVQAWDEAGRDTGPETSRLLHNAYVDWHEAREQREANYRGNLTTSPLAKTSTRTGASLREGRTDTGDKR